MATISRTKGKRMQYKKDVDTLNRKALWIGGLAAGGILLLVVISFLTS